MISAAEFNTIFSIRLSAFTPTKILSNSKILKSVMDIVPDDYDGEPTVLPLPGDAPPEIPRITFKDKNQIKYFEIAPSRVNVIFKNIDYQEDLYKSPFVNEAESLLKRYLDKIDLECLRIALNISHGMFKEYPETEIASHFCKDKFLKEPFDRPSEFEIHSLKKYKLKDAFDVNSWVRVKSVSINHGAHKKRAVACEQDINTLPELMDQITYDNKQISNFFSSAIEDANSILLKYFPY